MKMLQLYWLQDFIYNAIFTKASQEMSKSSGRHDVIYSGTEDESVFVIVKRNVAGKKTLVNFGSLYRNIRTCYYFL